MASRIGTTVVGIVTVAAVCAPAAWPAKPKLYSVALKGNVRSEASRTTDGVPRPPDGCIGTMSETHRFAASAGLTPKPSGAPVASYGRLRFRARLISPTVAATTTSAGSFEPDPNYPPADPSACSVTPGTKSWPCSFAAEATRGSGAEFALLPNKGKYELYYNRSAGLVSCDDEFPLGWSLLEAAQPQLTNLRVSAVKRLAKAQKRLGFWDGHVAPLGPRRHRRRDPQLHPQGQAGEVVERSFMSAETAHRIIVLTLVAVLMIGVGVPGVAPAMTDSTVTAVAKHKKKRKAVKCRKNQVADQAQAADRGLPVIARGAAGASPGRPPPSARQDRARRRPGGSVAIAGSASAC